MCEGVGGSEGLPRKCFGLLGWVGDPGAHLFGCTFSTGGVKAQLCQAGRGEGAEVTSRLCRALPFPVVEMRSRSQTHSHTLVLYPSGHVANHLS